MEEHQPKPFNLLEVIAMFGVMVTRLGLTRLAQGQRSLSSGAGFNPRPFSLSERLAKSRIPRGTGDSCGHLWRHEPNYLFNLRLILFRLER
jgi:hypothetical protein